jgi:putative NIF3 family GTP cyclohydrolase 1 type 2
MKLGDIYKLGIKLGMENDLRGEKAVKKHLLQHNKEYKDLPAKQKEMYDTEILHNPYPDSRIGFGSENLEVKKVLAGIDMDAAEVLLADRLGDINLVMTHHPVGRALAELDEVMHLQAEVLAQHGVPINVAQGIMAGRITEVQRRLHPANHNQPVDAAKLLNMAIMSAHTICDNMAAMFVTKIMNREKPETVAEILDILYTIPEYKMAAKDGVEPLLFTGNPKNYAGKIVVTEFTGGTEGSKMMYERISQAGIGTILSMHMSEDARKEAEKHHVNMVVAGHMSSDSLGMNLFLDELEKRGVQIVPTSGLIRISRNKKPRRSPKTKASAAKQRRTRPAKKNSRKRK